MYKVPTYTASVLSMSSRLDAFPPGGPLAGRPRETLPGLDKIRGAAPGFGQPCGAANRKKIRIKTDIVSININSKAGSITDVIQHVIVTSLGDNVNPRPDGGEAKGPLVVFRQ